MEEIFEPTPPKKPFGFAPEKKEEKVEEEVILFEEAEPEPAPEPAPALAPKAVKHQKTFVRWSASSPCLSAVNPLQLIESHG
jgi:hypothetical protein